MTLCELCHHKEARHRCRLCGRLVCEDHYDAKTGLCAACGAALCELCGERLAVTFCPSCGRLVCYEDSVQVDNVRRVCRECYARGVTAQALRSGKLVGAYTSGAVRLTRRVLGGVAIGH